MREREAGWSPFFRRAVVLADTTAPDAGNSTLTTADYDPPADGTTATVLTYTAKDANDVAMPGVTNTRTVYRTFVDADASTVGTDITNPAADGVEVTTISITVKSLLRDADGAEISLAGVPASAIVVAVSGTGNTVTQPSQPTDAGGTTTASYVSTVAETKTITVTVHGTQLTTQATVVQGGGGAGASYETGFEAATFAELNANGFVWASSGVRSTLSTENPRTDARSMRMAYQAAAAGSDSSTQRNFNFGQNVTEFWMEWYVYLPANYTTRSGESPNNNKWFRVWGDDYNGGNKIGASTAYNASYDDNTILRFEYIYKTYADGLIGFGPSGQQSPATSFGGSMKETWTRVRLHCKMVTAAENDGVMELWFGNTKVIDFQSVPAKYDDVAYWNQGYIFGAANSGFTDETVLYVDDWKWYASDPGWTF